MDDDKSGQGPWMETATPGKFHLFQAKIFPIVDAITAKAEYAQHKFVKKWEDLKRKPKPMSATISWRNLKVLLGIENMFQYKDFLGQCPEFAEHVRIQSSKTTRSGFDYGILELPSTDDIHVIGRESQQSTMDDNTVTDNTNDDGSYIFPSPNEFDNSMVTLPDATNTHDTSSIPEHNDNEMVSPYVHDTPRKTNILRDIIVHTAQDDNTNVSTQSLGTHNNLSLPDNIAWGNIYDVSGSDALQGKMQQMVSKFNTYVAQYSTSLADAETRLKNYEQNITDQIDRATSRLATTMTTHMNKIHDYTSTMFTTFKTNIHDYTDKYLATQHSKVTDMCDYS
jgi:hypothetical protein